MRLADVYVDSNVVALRIILPLLLACVAVLLRSAHGQDTAETTEEGQPGPLGPSANNGGVGVGSATCRRSQPNYQCCGARDYDPLKDTCCGGLLITGQPLGSCCGRTAFNPDRQGCCNGRVVNRPAAANGSPRGPLACCGTTGYDPRVSWCCGNKVVQFSPYTSCCAGQTYYSPEPIGPVRIEDLGICNKSQVHSISETQPGSPSSPPTPMICCGCRIYNIKNFCGPPGCCGDTAFDFATHICCNGALHRIAPKQIPECCGTMLLDPTIGERCCNGRTYRRTQEGPLCCPDGSLNSCCFFPDRNVTGCI